MNRFLHSLLSRKHLWGESIWVIVGQALFVIGGLVSTKVTLFFIEPGPYGAYSLALSFAILLQMTAFAGIPEAAGRFFATSSEKGQFLEFYRASLALTKKRLLIAVPVGFALFIIFVFLQKVEWASLTLGALVMGVNWAYNELLSQIHLAARDRIAHAIQQALKTWLNVLFLVAMVPLMGTGSGVAMWSVVASAVTVTAIQLFVFRKRTFQKEIRQNSDPSSRENWPKLIQDYAVPHIYWGLPLWLQMSAGRWSLEIFYTTEDVGKYSAVLNIGNASIAILIQILIQILSPYVFKRIGDATDKTRIQNAWRLNLKMIQIGITFIVIATFIAWAFSMPIMQLLSDPKYYSVAGFLPLAVLAGGMSGLSNVLAIGILSGNNSHLLIKPRVVLGIVGTLVTVILTSQLGMIGTFIAITIYGFAQNIVTLIIVRSHLKTQLR